MNSSNGVSSDQLDRYDFCCCWVCCCSSHCSSCYFSMESKENKWLNFYSHFSNLYFYFWFLVLNLFVPCYNTYLLCKFSRTEYIYFFNVGNRTWMFLHNFESSYSNVHQVKRQDSRCFLQNFWKNENTQHFFVSKNQKFISHVC